MLHFESTHNRNIMGYEWSEIWETYLVTEIDLY